MRRLAAAVIAAGLALVPAGRSSATETNRFGAEPSPLFLGGSPRRTFDVALRPGARTTQALRVWNRSDEPMTLRVYGAGVRRKGSRYEVGAYEARARGTGSWVAVDDTTVSLGPHASRIVRFEVRAPRAMPDGDTIAAVAVDGGSGVSTDGLALRTRIAILVRVTRAPGVPIGRLLVFGAAALGLLTLAQVLWALVLVGRRRPQRPAEPSSRRVDGGLWETRVP